MVMVFSIAEFSQNSDKTFPIRCITVKLLVYSSRKTLESFPAFPLQLLVPVVIHSLRSRVPPRSSPVSDLTLTSFPS